MASFCMLTGVQPSEYYRLTIAEKDAFLMALERRNK